VQFQVLNSLIAPVTIAVDGVPYVGLSEGRSSGLSVSSNAQWLTWTSAKPMDARRQLILDDIGEVRVSVSGINGTLEIHNVIADQTYVTARIFNYTPSAVSIGVFDGSSVSCVSELPGTSGTVAAFTQTGYYRLLPATEIRAYRDPAKCTGPYSTWGTTELKGFNRKSGLVYLTLDAAP
jgi:hypothetical protein